MRLQLKQAKICNTQTTKLNDNKSKCQRLISKMHQMRTQSTSLSNHLTAGYLEKEIVSMFISTVWFNKSTHAKTYPQSLPQSQKMHPWGIDHQLTMQALKNRRYRQQQSINANGFPTFKQHLFINTSIKTASTHQYLQWKALMKTCSE